MQIKPVKEIAEFLEKIATPMGIEIVEVEWNDKATALTVYIETETGVDLDTCEKFHNAILDPIDELDPTHDAPYTLNVSSPGLDRPFKIPCGFKRAIQPGARYVKRVGGVKCGVKLVNGVQNGVVEFFTGIKINARFRFNVNG